MCTGPKSSLSQKHWSTVFRIDFLQCLYKIQNFLLVFPAMGTSKKRWTIMENRFSVSKYLSLEKYIKVINRIFQIPYATL